MLIQFHPSLGHTHWFLQGAHTGWWSPRKAAALDPSLQEPRLLQQPGPSACQAFAPPPIYGSHQLQNQLCQHFTAAQTAPHRLGQHLQDLTRNQRSRLTPANETNINPGLSMKPSSSVHGSQCSRGTALQSLLNKNVWFCGFAISALFSSTTEE